MATLIKDRRVVADSWKRLRHDEALPEGGDIIVPLKTWVERRSDLQGRNLGVWLESHEGPEAIAVDLQHFALIAVDFPKYQDGRGFTTARLLRERYGYQGELRAIGQVARDHLWFMASCGFDAFLLREGENAEEALAAFDDFSDAYQASVARPVPLFRRRTAA